MPSILRHLPVHRHRSDGIDLLRGTLALGVLLAHLVPWTTAVQGQESTSQHLMAVAGWLVQTFQPHGELSPRVVAFIVLSGYCVHRRGFRHEPHVFRDFAIRRAFRILPVFVLASAMGLLSFKLAVALDPVWAPRLSGTNDVAFTCAAAKLTGLAALVPYFHQCSYIGNAPLATVMVEIWLYAAYGVFFYLFPGKRLDLAVLCLGVVSILVSLFLSHTHDSNRLLYDWWQNSSLWGFFPYWWIGALFLSGWVASRLRGLAVSLTIAWFALFMIDASSPILAEMRKLVFCGLAGCLIAFVDAVRLPIIRPLSLLGQASYSLYAVHAPLTYLLVIAGVDWRVILLGNAGCAALCYLLVERPLTRYGTFLAHPQRRSLDGIVRDLAAP